MTPDEMRSLWASHCRYEFDLRDVEGALSTMVDDPYLWNVPTMCGGRGREGMRQYYRDSFIGTLPDDAAISSVSLTVGEDQIAEEVILTFTHDREMPWILPDVAATGRSV
jgi:carboxymethylenebutenolidase